MSYKVYLFVYALDVFPRRLCKMNGADETSLWPGHYVVTLSSILVPPTKHCLPIQTYVFISLARKDSSGVTKERIIN